jgi:DNA polymerase-3 subunit alpha
MIPKNAGFVSSLENSRKESKDFDAFCNEHPDFYDICCSLSDLHNNFGCHPSAVIISSQPLAEFMPLQLSESGEAITGFAMTDVSNMAPKVDLLGLRCATLLSQCCAKLGIKTTDIDIHHPSIYDGLQNLEWPKGLFQIEADTNFNVTRKVKPRNLMHLAAVLSLARPGSIQFVGTYEKYVATGDAQSVHPLFDDILKESAGIPIYQESLMKCANRIGFSLDESETLRRIVGKKKREEMPEWKAKVEAKIKENNLDPRAGEILWKVMEDSASYSFNLSHAVAYASMCAATCYLKFNHPQIFYETLLNLAKDEPDSLDEIKIISGEMRQKGIALLPPDITKSAKDFAIEGDAVRFGLSNIRGISDTTMSKLVSFKRDFPDKFALFSGAKEAGLTIGVLQSLIMSGCVNIDKTPRTKLAVESAMFNELTQRERDNIY